MNTSLKPFISALLTLACITANAKPDVVAHATFWNCENGGMSRNSMAGVKAAFDAGFEWCELDVNYTRDGKIILFHDGASADGRHIFNDCTYDELKDVRLKNGERVPLLSEVLDFAASHPGTKLLIELKNCKTLQLEREFALKCVKMTKKSGLLQKGQVAFISFSANICKTIREAAPGAHIQFITYGKPVEDIVKSLDISGIDYEYHYLLANPSAARNVKNAGLTLNVWTCDKDEEMDRLIDLGVDMLTSNRPLAVRQRIASASEKEDTLTCTLNGVELGGGLEWADRNAGAAEENDNGQYYSWDDAVRLKFKNGWRLPTMAEMEWLMNCCKWTWTTLNGKKGFMVEGRTGGGIFLPACGHMSSGKAVALNSWGYYWSADPSTLFRDESFGLMFGGSGFYNWYSGTRNFRFPLRLVRQTQSLLEN